MAKAISYVKLIRPEQWVKNLFIFLPAFFSLGLFTDHVFLDLSIAFIAFSLTASAIYVFNDMMDVAEDRLHPDKCKRPIASGEVKEGVAYLFIVLLLAMSLGLVLFVLKSPYVLLCVLLYILQNVFYTLKLKHIAIIDVMIISVGFVIRLYIGGIVSNTALSHWIILMTFVLALFLAFAKRRDDAFRYTQTGISLRKNLQGYNIKFLDVVLTCLATVVIVCYLMYCTSTEVMARFGEYVYLTSFFVILGMLRYLQLTFVWLISGNPTKVLLKNRFLQAAVLGWIFSFFVIIYLNRIL